MEFIAREVKRSKKKKRLHAVPPDKPDFNSKGLYILLNFLPYLTSVGYKTPSPTRQKLWFCGNYDSCQWFFIMNINFFLLSAGKLSKTKTKSVAGGVGGSRLKAFDKELTDTSKKALKTFRQRFVIFREFFHCNGFVVDEW